MKPLYITIEINGEPFNCSSSMSLQDIINYLGLNSTGVLLEYNKQIISDQHLSNIFLKSNDQLEILTIVGGG
uniref:Thiamine biosynthesis protein S n=1 Tax=Kumanoa americana TaxID=1196377 RepID=A0A1C9CGQ8_9FLOR|nr:thiamine biosynthesis protein S [Kumanoa americana]AOM67580.1 thiamine biosynthesis protein S [Kumanoa americana]